MCMKLFAKPVSLSKNFIKSTPRAARCSSPIGVPSGILCSKIPAKLLRQDSAAGRQGQQWAAIFRWRTFHIYNIHFYKSSNLTEMVHYYSYGSVTHTEFLHNCTY